MKKPSDFYVGVIDFFAIVLPGAALMAFLLSGDSLKDWNEMGLILHLNETGAGVAFALASYAVGHIVFMIAAQLDPIYDTYRELRWPDTDDNAYSQATEERKKCLGVIGAKESMNTFSWAKSMLLLEKPDAASKVARYEADSKFFRSFFVVLLILSFGLTWKGKPGWGVACFILAVPTFLRYAERRYKSTEWSYRYVLALRANAHQTTTDDAE